MTRHKNGHLQLFLGTLCFEVISSKMLHSFLLIFCMELGLKYRLKIRVFFLKSAVLLIFLFFGQFWSILLQNFLFLVNFKNYLLNFSWYFVQRRGPKSLFWGNYCLAIFKYFLSQRVNCYFLPTFIIAFIDQKSTKSAKW